MTRCLEEEDDKLCDDEDYVPNSSTIRVKVFLPNGYPLSIILKSDATVQDAIEKTIRKSNALQHRFRGGEGAEGGAERSLAESCPRSPMEGDAKSPSESAESGRRRLGSESFASRHSEELPGSRAMTR